MHCTFVKYRENAPGGGISSLIVFLCSAENKIMTEKSIKLLFTKFRTKDFLNDSLLLMKNYIKILFHTIFFILKVPVPFFFRVFKIKVKFVEIE